MIRPIHCGALLLALAVPHVADAQSIPRGSAAPQPTSPPQVDETFAAWDVNHDKMLSLDEFRTGARGAEAALVMRRLQQQFYSVDKNHDGFIGSEEYKMLPLVKRAGEAGPALSAFDTDKDQKLNFAEYTGLVRSLAVPPKPNPAKP
jgi:Ca2+-binding EF-hand superfamily protein